MVEELIMGKLMVKVGKGWCCMYHPCPQVNAKLSAVQECTDAAYGLRYDCGGLSFSDVSRAYGSGSDFVMWEVCLLVE